jgi:hypothetical protein
VSFEVVCRLCLGWQDSMWARKAEAVAVEFVVGLSCGCQGQKGQTRGLSLSTSCG